MSHTTAGPRVPGFLGRVLNADGDAVGTCFQVAPGILVTAWHVVDDVGAGQPGDEVSLDPLAGGVAFSSQVVAVDPVHDLAVVRGGQTLSASADRMAATDAVKVLADVVTVGVAAVDDPGHDYRFLPAPGTWQGGATRDDAVALGVLKASGVMRGMSGAPVWRLEDDVVVGVISGRYNSADGWLEHSVWVARTEDLEVLLADIAPVELIERPKIDGAAELVLSVSETEVRLQGGGIDVSASHGGLGLALSRAVDEVRRARALVGGTRQQVEATGAPQASLALSRAGELLAEAFLPAPVLTAVADVLRQAQRHHQVVRVGVEVHGELARLPWEALPDPLDARPLALHPLVNLYRRVKTDPPRPVPGPLRILVAIAAPDEGGGGVLDYERELRNVVAAVRSARQGAAHVRIVAFASTSAIRAALEEEPFHVLHISGHARPGQLELEDDEGRALQLSADQFVDKAIPAGSMPPVVALAACSTDVASATGVPSFATRLTERGASVVIATETSVTDRYATRVFARVYGQLAMAATPDVVSAVAEARRQVQAELATSIMEREACLATLEEWAVLSVLAPGGSAQVFDPAKTAEVAPPARVGLGTLLARETGEFVGRRPEQRRWPVELVSPAVAGMVLHGIGGVGKTTLAAELARRVTEREGPWVPVVITGEVSVDGFLAQVAGTLRHHLALTGKQGPTAQALELISRVDLAWSERFAVLRDHVLNELAVLVVLDNFEDNLRSEGTTWVVRDETLAGLLSAWATSPGRSRLLITSRHPFVLPEAAQRALSFRAVGPLSLAETQKLVWSLPALDRLDEAQMEQVWHMVGGHPRSLEYLDALLSRGQGRYPDVSRRLARAVEARLGSADTDAWFAGVTTLDAALAETVTLAADDVLLDELLAHLGQVPGAESVLIGASVYREPVDANALAFQVGEMASNYHNLGALAQRRGDYEEAERRYRQALEIKERLGNQADMASSYHQLGTLGQDRGDYEEAERRYLQALEIKERLGNQADMASSYHQLGTLGQDRGDYEEAERRYRQALEIKERLGNQADMASSYHQLGTLGQDRGDYEEAERRYRQSLEIDERLGNQAGMAASYHQLGTLAQDRGDYEEAERRYRQSLEFEERLGNQAGMATSYSQLGNLSWDQSVPEEAIAWHVRALGIRIRIGALRRSNLRRLSAYRDQLGAQEFRGILAQVADVETAEAVIRYLDQLQAATASGQ